MEVKHTDAGMCKALLRCQLTLLPRLFCSSTGRCADTQCEAPAEIRSSQGERWEVDLLALLPGKGFFSLGFQSSALQRQIPLLLVSTARA